MKNFYMDRETRTVADLTNLGEMVPGTMTITRINVPQEHRGKGYGSTMLQTLCDEADRDGIRLTLEVFPSGALDYYELVAWYERYDFHWDKNYMYMERIPSRG